MRIKQNFAAKVTVLLATVAAFTGTWALVRDIASGEPEATGAAAPVSAPAQRYEYDDDDDDDDDDGRGVSRAPANSIVRVPSARTHAS